MASSPITSWQIEGEKVEVVIDFPFLGSKITMDGDWSREIRRRSEAMKLEDSFFTGKLCKPRQCIESRHITLLAKVCIVNVMVFPVVTYGCESRTIEKTECQKIMPSNCGAWEDSWKSLGQQGDKTCQS